MPSAPQLTEISASDIVRVFADAGILSAVCSVADRDFVCFEQDFLEHEFSAGLQEFQWNLGLYGFEDEANDCDDFAADANFYARLVHRRAPNRPAKRALAAGRLYCQLTPGDAKTNHAIDWFIVNTPAGLRLVTYEPQRQAVFGLSSAQRDTCFFWATP